MAVEFMEYEEFVSFYERYFSLLNRVAFGILGDERDSISVANLAMWYACSHPDKICGMPSGALDAYILKVVRTKSYDELRRRQRHSYTDITQIENTAYEASDEDPERIAEMNDFREAVNRCVLKMPDIYRDVLTLKIVNGMTLSEISAALGIPPDTAKTRCRRGLDILRRYLVANGYDGL